METISLKMEKELLSEIDGKLKEHRYSTRTEFIRDAIRIRLTELEKEKAIAKLHENFGKLKGKGKNISDEKSRELTFKEYAKKFNLRLD
jgi:Arc/MetJ-type ribon-helix-helix transcriptional regulator